MYLTLLVQEMSSLLKKIVSVIPIVNKRYSSLLNIIKQRKNTIELKLSSYTIAIQFWQRRDSLRKDNY